MRVDNIALGEILRRFYQWLLSNSLSIRHPFLFRGLLYQPRTVNVAMFSLTPPSFLIWQIYFPALAGSAFANCRVATFSTNVILMFSLSLITSSFSLSHWTEIGWTPSIDACNSAGSPATTVRLFSLETNLGGSEHGKMDGDGSKGCPDNGTEKKKFFAHSCHFCHKQEICLPFNFTVQMQVSLPTSFCALQWYSPMSEVSTLRIWILAWKFLDAILYFLLLLSCRLSLYHTTSNGGVPESSHSRLTSAFLRVSTTGGKLLKTGGSVKKNQEFLMNWAI